MRVKVTTAMLQINNLSGKIAKYQTLIKAATDRVISSGYFVLGPEVERFERTFAAFLGVTHCVTVANGTDAIELGLKSMGIGHEDRVATVTNAGMYTTTALLATGAKPYFMDVDLDSRGATLAEVMLAIRAGVKAVVVTHLYGQAIPEIVQIAKCCSQEGVLLLEDCAQAHGAMVAGKRVGTFGDVASFSFYPTKNLGALGDGGAVVTSNSKMASKLMALRQYGWTSKYQVEEPGARNSRLDELQAAILSVFLPDLDVANARRREIAARYSTLICHPDVHVPPKELADYVAHLYVVRSAQRDALREHLRSAGIASEVHYPIPDYRQPAFADRYKDIYLHNTEQLSKEILTLPCYPEMSDAAVDQVITAVNGWSL